jgi:hypothetical protein
LKMPSRVIREILAIVCHDERTMGNSSVIG